jgi:hypothetical protein
MIKVIKIEERITIFKKKKLFNFLKVRITYNFINYLNIELLEIS